MTTIDAHSHLSPPAYVEALKRRREYADMTPILAEDLVTFMDRFGIDATVVSSGPPGVHVGDQGLATELARLLNEELATVVQAEPRRFGALASLPLPDVDAALTELAHAADVLKLDGVTVTSQVDGVYLGDPALAPLLAELDRRGTYVMVHPTAPPYEVPIPEHRVGLYELTFETTRAIASLIYSGSFERYTNIRWQFAHLGGTMVFVGHRLASLADRDQQLADAAPAGALGYLARQFYDTALSNDEAMVEATRRIAPFEQIVFGSDWPFLPLGDGLDATPGLAYLGVEQRAALCGAHARKLVPRLFS
jgi:6-methylsalicylate decarboxylase